MTQVRMVSTVTKLSFINAAYVDGDVTKYSCKGTDQDEMEVSVTFSF